MDLFRCFFFWRSVVFEGMRSGIGFLLKGESLKYIFWVSIFYLFIVVLVGIFLVIGEGYLVFRVFVFLVYLFESYVILVFIICFY